MKSIKHFQNFFLPLISFFEHKKMILDYDEMCETFINMPNSPIETH